jgi:N-acyl-D-amino-acid deacylase
MLVFRGAEIYPGDGPPFRAEVGVQDGVIAAVGERLEGDVVEAEGAMLCPGFVDLHAHSALAPFDDPLLIPKVAQGFTTEVVNPDGLAPAPVGVERRRDRQAYLHALEGPGPAEWPWSTFTEYLDALDATRPATTLVPSAAHGAVRDVVIGGAARRPSTEQLAEMRRQVRLCLEAGARSLSFGLVYLPGAHADTAELVGVAEEAARAGVPLVPHVRNEGAGVLEAVGEMLDVARRSGASLHVSHLKSLADERLVAPLLGLLEEADVDVSYDQYPYGAGATLLASLLPTWAQAGGAAATLGRLHDSGARSRIARDVEHGIDGWENLLGTLGPERIEVGGRTIAEIADERGEDAVSAVVGLLLESRLGAGMILHYASEEAVREIARHRLQLVGTDGIFGERPHPRLYGSAARFLGRFALREGLLPVEEAVARLTARASDRLGLADRGRIAVGRRADLVLLDPGGYVDTATYDEPTRLPGGVLGVWVAGEAVWRNGAHTGARPGGVLR